MAVTKTFVDGEVLYSADLNTNFTDAYRSAVKTVKLNKFGTTVIQSNILPYTSTKWQNSTKDTTDGGATSSGTGYSNSKATICRTNKTKAISFTSDGVTAGYTADSGDTWTAASTSPANITDLKCVDFKIEGRAYIAGSITATTGLWYSTDGGINWTQVVGSINQFIAVSMKTATQGLAVDNNHNIFYTTDGTTWTDSTYNVILTSGQLSRYMDIEIINSGASISDFDALFVVRSTELAIGNYNVGEVTTFDGASNTTKSLVNQFEDNRNTATNFYKLTSGAICFATESSNSRDSSGNWTGSQGVLYITNDNGTSWYVIPLGPLVSTGRYSYMKVGDSISEYDTNKILLYTHMYKLFQIDLGAFV